MSRFALLRDTRRDVLTALLASVFAQEHLQDCLANQPFPDEVHAKLRADIDKLWNTNRKLDGRTLDEWTRNQPIPLEPNRRGAFALGGALIGALGGAGLTSYVKKKSDTSTTAVPPSNDVGGDIQTMMAAMAKAQETLSMYNGFNGSDVLCIKQDLMVDILESIAEAQGNYDELQLLKGEYNTALQSAMSRILEVEMQRLSDQSRHQDRITALSAGDVDKMNLTRLEAERNRLTEEVTKLRRSLDASEGEVKRINLESKIERERLTAQVRQLTETFRLKEDEFKSLNIRNEVTVNQLQDILENHAEESIAKDLECERKLAQYKEVIIELQQKLSEQQRLGAQGPAELQSSLAELQAQLDAANNELKQQRLNIAVGTYVTNVARSQPAYGERVAALDACQGSADKCAKDFFQFTSGTTETIRKLFTELAGLSSMSGGICHKQLK